MEHIVCECRQYGVKNICLSGLTTTDKLPEQLMKDFNIPICNICSRTPNFYYIDTANIMLDQVFKDGLHLSGKGKYVLIKNYLDIVLNFLEVVQYPRMNKHRGTLT